MFLDLASAIAEISANIATLLGPLNGFSFEWKYGIDVIIQISSTIILFLVIRFLFWKPITKMLESRKKAIDKELADAEEAKKNAFLVESEVQEELSNAKAQVKEMLQKAEKEAGKRAQEIIEAAQKEAQLRRTNLESELEQERKSMEDDIKKEIVDIAFQAAEKIVGREVNRDKYFDVVDEILKGAN